MTRAVNIPFCPFENRQQVSHTGHRSDAVIDRLPRRSRESFVAVCTEVGYRSRRRYLPSLHKARSLDIGSQPRVGFESSGNVSIYFKGAAGWIISPGGLVTLYYPWIAGVTLEGSPVPNVSSGAGWVQVDVPAGTYGMEFEILPAAAVDFDGNGKVNLADLSFFTLFWLHTDCNDLAGDDSDWCFGTDINQNDGVDINDFALFAQYWLAGL